MDWFCVHTRPGREFQIARYCNERLGIETYFPRLRASRTHRRAAREIIEPLFPRYLFARLEPSVHYRAVRYAPEVIDIVGFGGQPAIVDEAIIQQLRDWAGQSVDLITLQPELRPGDLVRITEGPFQGLEAIFLHDLHHPSRVSVLLSLLSGGARLSIDRGNLERVA